MKKTLLLLALAAGFCGAASAETVYYSTSLDSTTINGGREYYGFTLKLSDTFLTSTSSSETGSVTLPDSVYMTSLTLTGRSNSDDASYNNMKIAVYEYSNDEATGTPSIETDLGTVVALSDAHTLARDTSVTFSFDHIELDTSKQYRFLFVSADATLETLVGSSETTNTEAYQALAVSSGLTMIDCGSLPGGDGTYKNNTLHGAGGWEGSYLPKLKITSYVPEPTTATLSLLALAGLAARRRRK